MKLTSKKNNIPFKDILEPVQTRQVKLHLKYKEYVFRDEPLADTRDIYMDH